MNRGWSFLQNYDIRLLLPNLSSQSCVKRCYTPNFLCTFAKTLRTYNHLFMKKYVNDLRVCAVEIPRQGYVLLKLTPTKGLLPEILPGQFVEVQVKNSPSTFLRRPISVNFVDYEANQLWLLIHVVGEGTRHLAECKIGDTINCMYPLGNGFTIPESDGRKILLVGGGVGTAPLLYFGKMLREAGCEPIFLLGGRTGDDLMQLDLFEQYGRVYVTTEDGSKGERGFVTNHSILTKEQFDGVSTCGPKPMMVAVARWATSVGTPCEASLENLMACGLGACLCCVEKMADGHNLCVCKEGPVFNINKLSWLS